MKKTNFLQAFLRVFRKDNFIVIERSKTVQFFLLLGFS